MVSAQIVIRDTYEEAKEFMNNYIKEKNKQAWTIFGSEKEILEEFKYLESIGITDIMLRTNNLDDKVNILHNFVKSYNSREMV
jgi:anaerobic selenocysteine-containing dehydrogenase